MNEKNRLASTDTEALGTTRQDYYSWHKLVAAKPSPHLSSTSFQFVGTSWQPLFFLHTMIHFQVLVQVGSLSSLLTRHLVHDRVRLSCWQLFSSYIFSWHKLASLHELSIHFSSTSPYSSPHLPVCWHNLF
eukprot:g17960.t1